MFETMILRKKFGFKRDEVTGNCVMRGFMISTPKQKVFG
jgi:hypothetical protein